VIPARGIGVAWPCPMSRHEAAPPRYHATPDAKPRVCRRIMATTPMTFEAGPHSGPHAGRDRLRLFAHGIGIHGGHVHDGVAHPLGTHREGNAFVQGVDGIAVAQALGDSMGAGGDVRLLHHRDPTPPCCGTRPGPSRLITFVSPTSTLDFCEAVDHVERVQSGGRDRDSAVHALSAFFEAFHNHDLVGNIHASRYDMERFRETAPGVIHEAAQGAYGPLILQGGAEKRIALPRGEVEAPATGVVERGCVMHTATGYKRSVAMARPREPGQQSTWQVRSECLQPSGGECCTSRPITRKIHKRSVSNAR
jgi:hypothetical protein